MNKGCLSKLKLIFFILLLFSVIISSCKNENESYFRNPEKQIINELQQRRVVMLADFGHSEPLPYQSLIAVLNQWLTMIKNEKNVFRHLSLILESDDQIVNILKEFINSGDLNPVLDFWLPFGSLEDLEFYIDLKRIYMRVDSINSYLEQDHQISFDIFGGESGNIFNIPGMLKASKKESFNFFLNIRDSLIANRISFYLSDNPNNKALIFYGSTHLIKNYANKDCWGFYLREKKYGYYLAYYLKRHFGDNQVLSVNQKLAPEDAYKNTPLEDVQNEAVFLYSDKIVWTHLKPEDYDAFIFRPDNYIPAHMKNLIFSLRIIESCIHKIKKLKPSLPGFHAQRYYNTALNSLKFLSGKNYNNIEDWEYWYNNEYFSGFHRLDSEEFAEQVMDFYFTNYSDYKIRRKLFSFGLGPEIMSNLNIPSKDYWRENIWPKALHHIKFFNSVGLLWFGYSHEKQIGKEYLIEYTKKDFNNPDEYLKWWRKNFSNVKNTYFY